MFAGSWSSVPLRRSRGGGAFVAAGRGAPPALTIDKPERVVGQDGTLEVTAERPGATLHALTDHARAERARRSRCSRSTHPGDASHRPDRAATTCGSRVRSARQSVPELSRAPARIVVDGDAAVVPRTCGRCRARRRRTSRSGSSRRALRSSRRITSSTTAAPRWSSTASTPADVDSGVRVGDARIPGFPPPAPGRRRRSAVEVAFFALLHDQDSRTPIAVFARDEAGNEAHGAFVDNVFPKPFRRSRIELDDRFLSASCPRSCEHSPELKLAPPAGDLLPAFLRDQRRAAPHERRSRSRR